MTISTCCRPAGHRYTRAVGPADRCRSFVREVIASIRDTGMNLLDTRFRLLPDAESAFSRDATPHFAWRVACGLPLQRAKRVHVRSIVHGRRPRDAYVSPYGRSCESAVRLCAPSGLAHITCHPCSIRRRCADRRARLAVSIAHPTKLRKLDARVRSI
jgi:hypothetical protein